MRESPTLARRRRRPRRRPRASPIAQAARRLGIPQLKPQQVRVIQHVLAQKDALAVLPTGFGKSACYQIPSMLLDSPVVVVSPLLALLEDQYEKLVSRDIPVARLDSTVRGKSRRETLERIREGGSLLVMTTPETLASTDMSEALDESGVALVAVDEAHTASEWGHDFRPAYLRLGEVLSPLRHGCNARPHGHRDRGSTQRSNPTPGSRRPAHRRREPGPPQSSVRGHPVQRGGAASERSPDWCSG